MVLGTYRLMWINRLKNRSCPKTLWWKLPIPKFNKIRYIKHRVEENIGEAEYQTAQQIYMNLQYKIKSL